MVFTRFLQFTVGLAIAAIGAYAAPSDILLDNIPGGLSKNDLDTIMSLVSIAENSNTQWWTNYNYCEDIKDGRGFTVSLVGFCSGTGDLLEVVKDVKKMSPNHPLAQFIPALEKANGSPTHNGLEKLCSTIKSNGDGVWKKAVWNGIQRDYLSSAISWAAKHKLTSVFSKGFLFDVSLNHGASGLDQIAKYVKKGVKSPADGGNETAYMQAYIQARIYVVQKVDSSTNSGQDDRMLMWKSILDKNNLSLKRPMQVTCYKEKFTIDAVDGEQGDDTPKPAKPASTPPSSESTPRPSTSTKTPAPTDGTTTPAPSENSDDGSDDDDDDKTGNEGNGPSPSPSPTTKPAPPSKCKSSGKK